MRKRLLACLMSVSMVLTLMYGNAAAAESGGQQKNKESQEIQETQEISTPSNADQIVDTGSNVKPTETQTVKTQRAVYNAESSENVYQVATTEELTQALLKIASNSDAEATIELTKNVTVPHTEESSNVTEFGVDGKQVTVCSEGETKYKLNFLSRGILKGDCTFDNVDVTGYKLYCNGYNTIFTEDGEVHLSETLYGGGYMATVSSTHVVVAASGYINPSTSSGLHNAIGGSYKGSVEGDTYLEITGNIQMHSGNHLNPGCVTGDGTSGDGQDSPDVYVGGNATLIYDNPNGRTSPTIEGTYGCEMKGDVFLNIRSGRASEICGTQEYVDKSIIRGNLHIIAGAEEYENTDHTLRLNYNWPIVGAGNRFATEPGAVGNYDFDGNFTINNYTNVWASDRCTDPTSYDVPEIYGAIRGNVGGSITINAHGSHVQNIFGASDSAIQGSVVINANNVELKNSYYGTEYDEGYIIGLWETGTASTAQGPVIINIDGGDVGLVMNTDQDQAPTGSSINVTGNPKIRTGLRGTQGSSYSKEFPVANVYACEATIPFIKKMSEVNLTERTNVTVHNFSYNAGLKVEDGSSLTTDENQVWVWGDTIIDGTWEQKYDKASNYNDIFVQGTTCVGEKGCLIDHGTSNLKGDVTNNGMIALMAPAYFQSDYTANNAEIRCPAVITNYDGTENGGTIPLQIVGNSSGVTTVYTVKSDDWQTLYAPTLGDNYILSKKNGDAPTQGTFLLGNEDALQKNLFLKRVADADGTDDYYMWQVATGISVVFDKNGGDTDANPRIAAQEKQAGIVNHFDLPTTEPTREGYTFEGWNTKADGTGDPFTAATDVTKSMTVYAQWKSDGVYSVTISPMDITSYVGGNGYYGVIGEDGKFAENDLPEIGFYLTLPDDVNAMLGGTVDNPVDLSSKLSLTYDDKKGTTRSWELKLYGDETMSHVMENGRRVYIYKLLPSKINGTDEIVPARVQFTGADGSVMVDSKFKALLKDQFRNYKISFYPGQLDEQIYQVTITTTDGRTLTRPLKLGTGTLKVRGNTDETYREISNTEPSVDQQNKGYLLAGTAQDDTQYFINDSGVSADSTGVCLLVDHTLDDSLLAAYINQNEKANGKYTYQFRYLDLVDTHNGNAYVTMESGQKMNLYWPVPSDAKADSEFHIIHFKGLERESNEDINDLLTSDIPEELDCEKVTIDGVDFVKFSTESFSPFALLYEKGGSGSTDQPVDPKPDPSNPGTPVKSPSNADKQSPSNANRSDSSDDSDDSGSSTTTRKNQTVTTNTTTSTNTTETDQTAGGADETNLPGTTGENNESTSETVETDETKLPQTGQTWWPVWLLMMAGGALIFAGRSLKKREK